MFRRLSLSLRQVYVLGSKNPSPFALFCHDMKAKEKTVLAQRELLDRYKQLTGPAKSALSERAKGLKKEVVYKRTVVKPPRANAGSERRAFLAKAAKLPQMKDLPSAQRFKAISALYRRYELLAKRCGFLLP